MTAMQTARAYNHATGSNVTHREVLEWGIKEEAAIVSALEVIGILSG